MKAIALKNFSFWYEEKKILNKVSVEINHGEFVGIVGRVGSGKTTLLYSMCGLIPLEIQGKTEGKSIIFGKSVNKWNSKELMKKIAIVFQDPESQLFSLTVKEEIAFALKNFGYENIEKRIAGALKKVGLETCIDEDPSKLSSGEKKLITIACALARDAEVYIFDEPISNLDYSTQKIVYNIIRELNSKGKTIIVVEHNTEYLAELATKIIVMRNGRAIEIGGKWILGKGYEEIKPCGIKPEMEIENLKGG